MTRWICCAWLLLVAQAPPASVTPCLTQEGSGTAIDWTGGWVTATGRAPIGEGNGAQVYARRAAQVDGYRNLAEALGGVAVTVNQDLRDLADGNKTIKTRLDEYVQGARTIAQRVDAGPPTEIVVTLMAPLRGEHGLNGVLVDQATYHQPEPARLAGDWTGLVLDARRPPDHEGDWPLLRPALFPVITDAEGHALYGPERVGDEVRVKDGVALYIDVTVPAEEADLPAAEIPLGALSERVGERPLYLRATPVAGGDCTVYLSDSQRARFDELDPETVLAHGKVLILRRTVVKE